MSAMPEYAMTYVVWWAEERVLKVGRTCQWYRIEAFKQSGAQVLILARGTDATWEREALRVLAQWFPKAFVDHIDAWSLLPKGSGWTECFSVSEHHLPLAVELCFEGFAEGNEQGVNEERATEDQRGRSRVPRVHESAARGEADSDRAVDESDGRGGPVPVGAGVDRRGNLPGGGGDGADHLARPDARGVRVPCSVRARRGTGARPHETAQGGPAFGGLGHTPTTLARGSAKFRGYGGSAGAGGSASACRAGRGAAGVGGQARAGVQARTPADAGRASDRMPGPPGRHVRGLRSLRNCQTPARQVRAGNATHHAHDQVGGAG